MKKVIEVKGFVHHNQPYGTDVVDGVWTRYDQSDIDELDRQIEAVATDTSVYWKDQKVSSIRDHRRMIEARIAADMGVLIGTITKGSSTARLFQHTSVKDNAGNAFRLETVRLSEVEAGSKVSVAM
jgi:hypothetical protein